MDEPAMSALLSLRGRFDGQRTSFLNPESHANFTGSAKDLFLAVNSSKALKSCRVL